MAKFNVYVKTLKVDGSYEADFRDITKHVQNLGQIAIDTDSSDYQIGVYKNSNVSLVLDNREGLFSDTGQPTTIFKYSRNNSILKITYNVADENPQCGTAICGEAILSEEVEIFKGLLNDDSTLEDAKSEQISFSLLGYESLFANTQVPFSLLEVGDTISAIIYKCLNQLPIVSFLTIDSANISPSLDQAVDVIDSFENQTIDGVIDDLLFSSNSVLYILNDTVYVKSRAPSDSLKYTFYGQGSIDGVENTLEVKNISNGKSRTFNFITWTGTSLVFAANASMAKNGIRKKDVAFDFFTDITKQGNILTAIGTEFKNPKQELELTTPAGYGSLDLSLLDRVNIDYPTVLVPWESSALPVCGQAICGAAVLPKGLWSLTINPSKNFKILKRSIEASKHSVTFKLREI